MRYAAIAVACLFTASVTVVAVRQQAPDSVFIEDDSTFVEPVADLCARGSAEDRGKAALGLVRYPWQTLGFEVVFHGPRKGYLAITYIGGQRIEVYVRRCQSVDSIASILGHEFAHAVDHRYMTDAERAEYLALRGISPRPWFGCNRCSDFATPAGDFAEVFAYLKSPPSRFRSRLGRPPSAEQAVDLERFYFPDATTPPLLSTTTPAPPSTTTTTPAPCRVALGETCLVP